MERYDRLYRLYQDFDTDTLRAYQDFVNLFPPVDSRPALEYWEEASDELASRKTDIHDAFPETGGTYARIAATATRDQAFTALDLVTKYNRRVNALVLDVDETLRTAGNTDNEIPRETLHLLTDFLEDDIPIIVCTGQTLENVKGFLIQGLGNELVHSGTVSIVYEAGSGVFTPDHGANTKRLLYQDLDDDIRAVFDHVRTRVLTDAPTDIRSGCHLQGNEFNVTLKPNFESATPEAKAIIDIALILQLDLLGDAITTTTDLDSTIDAAQYTRVYYADRDPEIRRVLDREEALPSVDLSTAPDPLINVLDRTDVGYYEADAAEITSLELNKVVGVQGALDVLEIQDPFVLVMGDSKSDLRVMEWIAENNSGIAAAPEHASTAVLDHVIQTDELVYPPGGAPSILRTTVAMNQLAKQESSADT